MSATDDNKRLMQAIFEGLARGDARLFLDSLDEAAVWRMIGTTAWSGVYAGKAAIRRDLLAPLFAQFADQYLNVADAIVAEGDTVVVECRGKVATRAGQRYDNTYCWVCRLADGKIVSLTEYMDTQLVATALRPPVR
ncbi:nuclear transport factor 2 family protein [Caulobacter sp. BE254]|uniref:nuclear transport factor 2 family protein n=1 Tax=Caulobacter sp. BE254 TaxID=2817720 RepID=UPI00285C5E9A|nr:nuclear transport factor 2 family protein [Caulobacter sp. BE254]MDR7115659.1 ketosteroid isomerase-like protein [Caulobacter sp. BE254]